MTLTQIRTRFRLLVPEVNSGILSDTNLNLFINDGALDVVRRTDCLWNVYDQDVVDGTRTYSPPSDSIKILEVWYGGTGAWEKLPKVTMQFLAHEIDDEWMNNTGTICSYYEAEQNTIGLYRTPTSNEAGTSYLRIYYVEQPDTLVNDSDTPFNNMTNLYPYHDLILLYAMYKAKQMMGKWEQAVAIENNYLAKCREMKVELNKLDDFQQPIRAYYKGIGGASIKQDPLSQL